MQLSTTASDPVSATLRPLLLRQLARLRRRYLWHGLGMAAILVTALVLLFFGLDRWLLLPVPIRLLHTLAVGGALVFAVLRFVRYPLQRAFSDVDLALWLEHTYPELHDRLVSAVQLQSASAGDLRNQSRAMVEALWQETAAIAPRLRLDALFDARGTARLLGGAMLIGGLLFGGALWSPTTARTFVLRHLGMAVDYPRDTTLHIELPPAGPDLQRTDRDDVTELVLPAGADLIVSVLAEGSVPKEVSLVLRTLRADGEAGDERALPMTPRPGDRFRHVFRRLSGAFEFHASGGDDDRGDRRVVVRTVRPAQVATLAASIEPPAYTGIATIAQEGGAIEALAGSRVDVTVTTTSPALSATMVFLESGRRLELQSTGVQDDGGASLGFRGGFVLEATDRYQIELVAPNGLRNPNPGTYPISALQDYAPVGRWLLPEDDGLALLPTAILCLRLEAHDDFGLAAVGLTIERGGERIREQPLLPTDQPPTRETLRTELLEVGELLGKDGANDGLVVAATLQDNKQPAPGVTDLPRRIVQIVDGPQLAAVVAKLFRGLREEVAQAAEIQTDRRSRLADLLAREGVAAAETAQILTGVEVGQGRVASGIARVHRGLMRAFDLHLWNRLEPSQHAAAVVDLYREHSGQQREPLALDPVFYRDLAERRAAGTLGAMETTLDPILAMIGLADGLGSTRLPAAARLIAEAQVARGAADRAPLLQQAIAIQERVEADLQQLLLRLEEWNDYQDLVQEVRALRDRQRDLQSRTEEARGK